VVSVSAVVLVQGLCRDTVEELAREDAKQCPCKIKGLEDVPRVVCSLCHKLPLKFVEELQVKLCKT